MLNLPRLAVLLNVAAVICLAAPGSQAAAPFAKVENPGFYRMMLGDFEVTALSDGSHVFPVDTVMIDTTAEKISSALAKDDLALPLQGSINAFLVNTGTKLVLIDTGAGALYGDCCGTLLANLRASGYQPEQVDEVLLTHLHKDHVGGIAAGGTRVFPNAVVRVAQVESSYWLSSRNRAKAPDFLGSFFDSAAAALAPYAAAGRVQSFSGNVAIVPGIASLAEAGHTPGHTGYLVESRGQKLLVWGDIVHVAPVQLADVQASVKYDSDDGAAQHARGDLLARAAREHLWIGAAHIAFPGLGHVQREGEGYRWVPANYQTVPIR